MTNVYIRDVEGGEDTTPATTDAIEIDTGTTSYWVTLANVAVLVWNYLTSLTAKTTLVDADQLGLADSAASNVGKKITWQNVMAQAAAYSQTLTNKTLTSPVINSATGVGQQQYIIKSANETVNNGGVQNDDHFSFAIAASEKWYVEIELIITSVSNTSDFVFDFTAPAACTGYFGVRSNNNTSAGNWGGLAAATTASATPAIGGTAVAIGSGNVTWTASVVAIITNSTNAGTIQFRWGQNTPTAENTVVLANSFMRYTRLA